MADEEKKRPVVASLVFAAISAMVLSPLYPIALGFKGLAGSAGGTGSTLTAVLYALPVLGAVVTGAACLGSPNARLAAIRGSHLTAGALVVLLVAFLTTLNSAKTIMIDGIIRTGADKATMDQINLASQAIDSFVPMAFGACGVGIAICVFAGWRFSRT